LERARLIKGTVRSGLVGDSRGSAGIGIFLLFSVAFIAFLLVCEFYYAFNVRQGVDIELTRAVNIAVDLSMSDAHRQDRILELDAGAAYERFREYLHYDMRLSGSYEARSAKGDCLYALEFDEISVNPSPPGMRVSASVSVRPLFLGRIAPAGIRFPVRCSSVNRRID
jgi:hypothetical protein